MSDPEPDGSAHALTVIAMIGNVFSPYYAWQRRRHGDAGAEPQAHCAMNVSLYSQAAGAKRYRRLWSMTERSDRQLQRDSSALRIGRSHWRWQGPALHIELDEWTAPWPQRLRGRLTLQPQALPGRAFALDTGGHHLWQPIAPLARIEVEMDQPQRCWQGEAYLDHNHGSRPLARDFESWQWSRARSAEDGSCRILYDAQAKAHRAGAALSPALHLHIDSTGRLCTLPMPPPSPLPTTAWRLPRHGHAYPQAPALAATLESGPFYARSVLQQADGSLAVHESLSLARFEQAWVQALLPFRMPRRG
ncbi:MAG: carotenoid 1,2-hydratase [Ideonella sp.]|nr:carotenoid 1,2-hydratase [Ideonella sp.]